MKREDAKSVQILKTLREEILSGRYSRSGVFPSEIALSRRFKISRSTMSVVVGALEQEGFVSRSQGRSTRITKHGTSRLVGLVTPGISYSSEFFQPIVSEFVRRAKGLDYTILMDGVWSPNACDNGREAIEVAARLIRRRVAGVIYQPLEYSEDSEAINRRVLSAFTRAGIPVVLLDGDIVPGPARSEYDLVAIDNEGAGEIAVQHLLRCGAKNVRFLMRANWVQNVKNRMRGVRNAVLSAGLRWRPSSVVLADPSDAAAVRAVMRSRPRPDAFVCENDVLAAELKRTLIRLGHSVPGDVQLVGFDDIGIARLSSPGLTSIHQPCEQIAATAFDRLLRRIENPALPPTAFLLAAPLVVRASTKGEVK